MAEGWRRGGRGVAEERAWRGVAEDGCWARGAAGSRAAGGTRESPALKAQPQPRGRRPSLPLRPLSQGTPRPLSPSLLHPHPHLHPAHQYQRIPTNRARKGRQFAVKSYGQTSSQDAAPFADMFGSPDDIFSEVLVSSLGSSFESLIESPGGERKGVSGRGRVGRGGGGSCCLRGARSSRRPGRTPGAGRARPWRWLMPSRPPAPLSSRPAPPERRAPGALLQRLPLRLLRQRRRQRRRAAQLRRPPQQLPLMRAAGSCGAARRGPLRLEPLARCHAPSPPSKRRHMGFYRRLPL